jgi:hypothetical protein
MVVATLSKGYDLDYIWKQVDRGPAKDAASYYIEASESGGEWSASPACITPLRWLHATVLLVGPAANPTRADLDQMLTKARLKLNGTPPASVTLGRAIYHPEGIVLPISPQVPWPHLRSRPGRHP